MQELSKISTEAKVIRARVSSGVIDLKAITQILDKVGALQQVPAKPRPKRDRVNYYKSTLIKNEKYAYPDAAANISILHKKER